MRVSKSPDIFQKKMNDSSQGFEFIHAFIYDLLKSTKRDWTDHVHKLELSSNKFKESRLKYT